MIDILFLLSYFSSKFYIFDSGLPQPSHFLLIILIFCFIFFKGKVKVNLTSNLLLIFLSYVTFVNIVWCIFSNSFTYINSLVFWIFNFLTFLTITNIIRVRFSVFQNIILISFLVILICWVLGLGRYSFNPRYNFFFNDPNQLAFWVLCSLSIYLLKPNKMSILVISLGFFIVMSSMSRSAILGLVFILIGYTFFYNFKYDLKKIFTKVFAILFLFISIFIILNTNQDEFKYILDRFVETDVEDQADIRGYTALLKYPEYLFFGAGQGEYYRFSSTNHEIHSTWAGLLFYYGVVGFIIFIFFLWSIWTKLSLYEKIIFLAPLIYGFSTYGLRTSIFWFFISIYVIHIELKKRADKV